MDRLETVLTSHNSPESTPRQKLAKYNSMKIAEDPTLVLRCMIPARTHAEAIKSETTKKLEKELAYYMGEIEKKFNKSEIRDYKFKRTAVKDLPVSKSQPPPMLQQIRTSNSA